MQKIQPKIDGISGFEPDEYNSVKNERQNIIRKAGLAFDSNDQHQLTKAVQILRQPNVYFTDTGTKGKLLLTNPNLVVSSEPPENLIVRFKSNNLVIPGSTAQIGVDGVEIPILSPFDDVARTGKDYPYNPNKDSSGRPPFAISKVDYFTYYDGKVIRDPNNNNTLSLRLDLITPIWNHEVILKLYQEVDADTAVLYIPYCMGNSILNSQVFSGILPLELVEIASPVISFKRILFKTFSSSTDTTGSITTTQYIGTVENNQTITAVDGDRLLLRIYYATDQSLYAVKLMGIL